MTPAGFAQLLRDSGPYGLAGLCIAGMLGVFWFYRSAMDARIEDLKTQLAATQADVKATREALEALHAKTEARQERLAQDVDRVVGVQVEINRALSRRKSVAKDGV